MSDISPCADRLLAAEDHVEVHVLARSARAY